MNRCKNASKAALRARFKDRSYAQGVLRINLRTCAEHTSRNLGLINSRCSTLPQGPWCRLVDFGMLGNGIGHGDGAYAVVDVGGDSKKQGDERFAMLWGSHEMLANWIVKRMSEVPLVFKKKINRLVKGYYASALAPLKPVWRQRQVLS